MGFRVAQPPRESYGVGEVWLKEQLSAAEARLGVPPPGGWMPADFAPAFGQRVRRFGPLTVLGPAERVAYARRFGPPRYPKGVIAFLATLSQAQWTQLCGSGIRLAALTPRQQEQLEDLLPSSLIVSQEKKLVAVSPLQRQQILLTLCKGAWLQPKMSSRVSAPLVRSTAFGWTISGPLDPTPSDDYDQVLLQSLPSRGGTGELNAGSLRGSVSLLAEKPLTVAQALERLTERTRVSLKADRRVAALPLWIRGTESEASALAEALCFALGGVFRRTESGFLLVEEVVPLLERRAAAAEWLDNAERAKKEPTVAELERFDPLHTIAFPADDPCALTAEQQEAHGKGKSYPFLIDYSKLTTSQRTKVDEALKYHNSIINPEYRETSVAQVQFSLFGCFRAEIPGLGTLLPWQLGVRPRPPFGSVSLQGRTVLAAATTPEQVKALVQEMETAGAGALWLDASPELLSLALREAKLPILAYVRLLRSTTGAPAVNCLGESWSAYSRRRFKSEEDNWLDPGVESNQAIVLAQVRAFVFPKLAGLVFTDTVPPGFRESTSRCHTAELGYTPERRRAFLEKQGVDPTDLLPYFSTTFSQEKTNRTFDPKARVVETWNEERQAEVNRFLVHLRDALEQDFPSLPLWWGGSEPWVVRWPKGKPAPLLYPYYEPEAPKGYEQQGPVVDLRKTVVRLAR